MIRNRPTHLIAAALVLGLMWIILTGELRSIGEFAFGTVLGLIALRIVPRPAAPADAETSSRRLTRNPLRILAFGCWFIYYIVTANIAMVRAVLGSINSFDHLKPAIIAYETQLTRAIEITVLANWITLTPGTLTMEITPDGKTLFIHTFNMGESREAFHAEIYKLEMHVLRLFS